MWNPLIYSPLGGFIIILLGAMFLFAEVLVKGRFILGFIGAACFSLYFMAHIPAGQPVWMAGVFILGVILVILDGKFIGDGTIGAIGLILMLVALALPAPNFFYGLSVATAFILGTVGSFGFRKILPSREVWNKLALKDTLSSEAGYNSMNEQFRELLDKEGVAETDFRPIGTIRIEGQLYSAVSDGQWVKKGNKLKVVEVSGTRILVQKVENND